MDWQAWLVLSLTVAALLCLIFSHVAPYLVMMGVMTLLSVSGVISPAEALSGFANPGLITVAAMFVVAAGVHASGGIDLLGHRLLGQPTSQRGALLRIFAPVAALSAFVNNTPLVATMIPVVHSWSRRINIPASKLMIPLSYTAILGGTLTMIGTSTNLVVNGQYQALTGDEGFSLFSITLVGLPVAAAGMAFMWLFFPRLLPHRQNDALLSNLREFTLEVSVAEGGPLVGKSIAAAGLRNLKRIYLVEIDRGGVIHSPVAPEEVLCSGDRLVFAGDTDAISDLLRIKGIAASDQQPDSRRRAERRLVEVAVSSQCEAIGQSLRRSGFRERYGAAVLAVARGGERVKGNLGTTTLEAGDILLLETGPGFIDAQRRHRDFLLVSDLGQEAPRHDRAWLSLAILVAVVGAAGVGVLSMLNAALIGAGLMIACGCCSLKQAERSLDLTVILTIAASFALGAALEKTGVAKVIAENIVALSFGQAWLMLALTYIAVSLLTETISNNAAAVIMLPIALGICESSGLNPEPFVFAIMMAASASFATPLGYQTNLMVLGPGDYRFADFVRVGVPMNIFVGVVTLVVLLVGWPLYLE